MRPSTRAALVVLLLACAEACRRSSGTVAIVGGRRVTLDALVAAIAAEAGKPSGEVDPDLAAALAERYLEEEVVLAGSGEAADRALAGTARSARARDLLASLCPPAPPPDDSAVAAYLAAHPDLVPRGERLLIRQLVLPDQASARAAQERARRGEDFAALSRELSRAPNAATGGALGWIERGQLPPEFEAAVFSLPARSVSAPVASNAGWHVFQVVERRPGGEPDASSRALARALLAGETAEDARRECLRALAARVGVEVTAAPGAPFEIRNPFEEKP